MHKLCTEFGIRGRMWLLVKNLCSEVKAQALYSGSLTREFEISQGTGQGRILTPFMYKVHVDGYENTKIQFCNFGEF